MVTDASTTLADEYVARTPRSAALGDRLRRAMPGGQTRSIVHYDPYPVVLAEGSGPRVRDVDGNEYLDVLNNYTALVHGHRHPVLAEAARAALATGTVFPSPHESQLVLAEMLLERLPAAGRVRFTNSGSEATILALRIARAATGRPRVLAFAGAYHGSVPELTDGGAHVVRVPYNDVDAAEAAVDGTTAAVLVEPFLGVGGVVPAAPGFLERLAAVARAAGSLLILDEVQSLRNAFAGVHGSTGLAPDIVLLGKVIGGGFPVGAVVGRSDLLDLTDARRPGALPHAGTFNGNVATMRAGAAALTLLDATAIASLNARAASLADGIADAGRDAGVPVAVTRAGSILHVHLSEHAPTAAVSLDGDGSRSAAALHLALLLEGVYAAPRGLLNLSTVTTDADLAEIAAAYGRALGRVRDAFAPSAGVPGAAR